MIAGSIFRTGPEWAFSPGFSGRNGMLRDIGTATSGPGTKQAPGAGGAGPGGLEEKPWRRATLPRPIAAVPSPLGPFTSVFGMGTGVASPPWPPRKRERRTRGSDRGVSAAAQDNQAGNMAPKRSKEKKAQASRTISTGRVNALPRLRLRPIEVVVFHRP